MIREPREAWQAELEATAGYERRHELDERWYRSKDPADFEEFKQWMKSVTWPAELALWQKVNDWYASQLQTMSSRRRTSLPQVAVRCREKGCLLGRVYCFALQGGGSRIYFVGRTSSGKPKHGVCNWPFADSLDGLTRWWQVGCKHGHTRLDSADLVELVVPPTLPSSEFLDRMPEQVRTRLTENLDPESETIPEEHRLAWRAKIYLPPHDRWIPPRWPTVLKSNASTRTASV
ncbi:hypothetical protein [Amycolatopsis sp. lyj-109]|uniref:hypothetical protein n=1 Tax=Amycolatopsis sp. lyj-109 TaxID=2789287 RepID=UPI00397E37F5